MVAALIKFTQGPNTAAAGVACKGTLTDGSVVVSNGNDAAVNTWKYELLYVAPDSVIPLTTQGPGPLATFTFAQPDKPGCYRVRLTVADLLGNSDVDMRNFGVPFPNFGLIAPPYQGLPLPLPLVGPGAKPNEMNFGATSVGWDGVDDTNFKLLYQALKLLDSLVAGSNMVWFNKQHTSDITAINMTGLTDGCHAWCRDSKGTYEYESTSTATADGADVLTATPSGRWHLLP